MKNQLSVIRVMAGVVCFVSGCGGLRYGATEAQKENAWAHSKVCAMAQETAADEGASERLCGLTGLAAAQSEAFVLDYGLPENPSGSDGTAHSDDELKAVLSEGAAIAETAKADSARRPDAWELADGAMELGLTLAGLLGGVYGTRAAGFLRQAREKSAALKEIVAGNELFKQLYPEQAERFKEAQAKQSAATKQIVTELKG
jgi:hypothetical protein